MEGLIRRLQWQGSRWWQHQTGKAKAFSSQDRLRVLLLTESNPISQSQVFPFHFYEKELFARWRHELREVSTADFEKDPESAPGGADIVAVQTWIDLSAERCDRLFGAIRARNPKAKIAFLDSFAPVDLRFAKMLDPHVDLYVKKHVFRERSRYFEPTRGDTNLTDYYGALYGIDHETTHYEIPPGFLDKLVVGPSFATAPRMLPHFFDSSTHRGATPQFDVHARLAATGSGWYQQMRQSAIDTIDSMRGRSVLSRLGVSQRRYMRELRRSRVSFSPFGYGEVCWRDYEAVLCGALLVKPDMSHVETVPDIFVPFETYIPVAWDFSDLVEKVDRYLNNEAERVAITSRAYERLHRHARSAAFVDQMERLFRV